MFVHQKGAGIPGEATTDRSGAEKILDKFGESSFLPKIRMSSEIDLLSSCPTILLSFLGGTLGGFEDALHLCSSEVLLRV